MKYNPDIHHRRSIRLKDYDYAREGAYYVTILAKDRENLFGDVVDGEMRLTPQGKIAQQFWFQIAGRYRNVELDECVVMPNHVHGIIIINETVGAIHELPLQKPIQATRKARRLMLLPKIIGWFKMNSAKRINELRKTPGLPVWQRNYYEHIIRNEEAFNKIREYIFNNPLRWEFDQENPRGQVDKIEQDFWNNFGREKLHRED